MWNEIPDPPEVTLTSRASNAIPLIRQYSMPQSAALSSSGKSRYVRQRRMPSADFSSFKNNKPSGGEPLVDVQPS
jgi:hypothetical protein